MNLMNKIPREFYKLFASKYMDYYQQFLTAIYEESGRSFSLLGLTEGECRAVISGIQPAVRGAFPEIVQ